MSSSAHNSLAHDCLVLGAGPAGLTAALALAHRGVDVGLIATRGFAQARGGDTRTTAVLEPGLALFANLGLADRLARHSAPLEGIRIVDDLGSLWRAPDVLFHAREMDREQFGANIANVALVQELAATAATSSKVTIYETTKATSIDTATDAADGFVTVTLAEGDLLKARLLVGADGRASMAREAAGISAEAWHYPQSALATAFGHTRDHNGISTEFHRSAGPFTTVPMPASLAAELDAPFASSLVWVDEPERIKAELARDDMSLGAELARRTGGLLGSIRKIGPRAAFPISGLTARSFGARRIALVGEAAHVLPPIGAQGLNLGLRDGAELAGLVGEAISRGDDVGADALLAAYDRARRPDVLTRTWAVDGANRALLLSGGVAGAVLSPLRVLGLSAAANIGPLRRFAMTAGLEPMGGRPALMRPAAGLEPQTAERR